MAKKTDNMAWQALNEGISNDIEHQYQVMSRQLYAGARMENILGLELDKSATDAFIEFLNQEREGGSLASQFVNSYLSLQASEMHQKAVKEWEKEA